jgi:hypothetical protein
LRLCSFVDRYQRFKGTCCPHLQVTRNELWYLSSIRHAVTLLSIYLSIYLSVCLSIYLSICLSIYMSVCLSVYLSICMSVSIYLSVCLSIHLSVCLSIYLQPFFGPWPILSSLTLHTVGRTPWTGDQPVAWPLPIHRTTQTQNKRTQTSMPRVGFEFTSG